MPVNLSALEKMSIDAVIHFWKSRKTHHVVPNSKGGWDVKKGGGERSIKHFDKKQDAVDFGRSISKN